MGLPVTVYKSSDAGAPQLVDYKISEVINILKKCLVDGYGTKQPLGWTLADENAPIEALFRNSTADGGSGGYLKVSSSFGNDNPNPNIRIDAAMNATSINDLVNRHGYREFSINKTYSTGNTDFKWMVIGTSRSIWFFVNACYNNEIYGYTGTNTAQFTVIVFVGDIDSTTPGDLGQFTILDGVNTNGDSSSASWSSKLLSADQYYSFMYPTDGSTSTRLRYRFYLHQISPISYVKKDGTVESHNAHPSLIPIMLCAESSDIYAQSVSYPLCRGTVPGGYNSSFHGYGDITLDNCFTTLSGIPVYYCRAYRNSGLCIRTDTWYE